MFFLFKSEDLRILKIEFSNLNFKNKIDSDLTELFFYNNTETQRQFILVKRGVGFQSSSELNLSCPFMC